MLPLDVSNMNRWHVYSKRSTMWKSVHITLPPFPGSLELLSLAGNILRQVPTTALYPLHSLVILYLNNNQIERINHHDFPAQIGHGLTDLHLQNNMSVSFFFYFLLKLKWTFSSYNFRIQRIHPKAFGNLSRIHWIKLSNNLLENGLDYGLLGSTLNTLQCIDMHSKRKTKKLCPFLSLVVALLMRTSLCHRQSA